MEKLIYDRTENDVKNKTDKGYHNISDLNRIEEWCRYLADVLSSYNYKVDIVTRVDWKMTDFRYDFEIERIRKNIEILRSTYSNVPRNLSVPDSLSSIDFIKANEIEKILWTIESVFSGMENNFIKSGIARSGQMRVWQQRFRRLQTWLSMSNSIESYNSLWSNVVDNNITFSGNKTQYFQFPLVDKRDYIWGTISTWNSSLIYFDIIVGG